MNSSSMTTTGKTFSFQSGGMIVYVACVFVVNAVLLRMTNNYTGYSELMILLSCGLVWVVVAFENYFKAF